MRFGVIIRCPLEEESSRLAIGERISQILWTDTDNKEEAFNKVSHRRDFPKGWWIEEVFQKPYEIDILNILKEEPSTADEIAIHLGIDRNYNADVIRKLLKKGKIRKEEDRYFLNVDVW